MRQFFEYLRETVWRSRLKSCFCVAPVRVGLICLGYIHVVVAYIQIVSISTGIPMFWPMIAHIQNAYVMEEEGPSASICVVPPATDLAFTVLLIAGLHKRDVLLLRVYCGYGLADMFLGLVVYGLLEAVIAPLYCIVIVFSAVYQIYVLLLIRSLIIEIEMNNADDNKYSYSKDQGAVIIRDVESPTPRPLILEGYRVLPALPAPDLSTSVTTLSNVNERTSPVDSKFNTLNNNGTLRTSTLNYRSPYVDVSGQRSATLPHQETAIVHTQTPKIGAIQSLAGPSNLKPSNTDTLKREFIGSGTITTDVSNKNKTTETKSGPDKDNTKSVVSTDTEERDAVEPLKKKRGFFKRSNKEKTSSKKDDEPVQAVASSSEPTKSTEHKDAALRKEIVNLKVDPVVRNTTDILKVDDVKSEERKEAAPKKKRSLFKKAIKEKKEEKKEDSSDKGNEA